MSHVGHIYTKKSTCLSEINSQLGTMPFIYSASLRPCGVAGVGGWAAHQMADAQASPRGDSGLGVWAELGRDLCFVVL